MSSVAVRLRFFVLSLFVFIFTFNQMLFYIVFTFDWALLWRLGNVFQTIQNCDISCVAQNLSCDIRNHTLWQVAPYENLNQLRILGYLKCAQCRFWSDCANPHAYLKFWFSHMSECTFSDVAVNLLYLFYVSISPRSLIWVFADRVCLLKLSSYPRRNKQNRREGNDQEPIQLSHTPHQRHQKQRNTNTK